MALNVKQQIKKQGFETSQRKKKTERRYIGEEQKKKGLHSNLVRFFAQNQVKSKKEKKRSSLKIIPIFRPNVGASLKETHKTYPLCDQTLCPTCKRGGHASILHTIQCTYTILATQRGGHGPMAPP